MGSKIKLTFDEFKAKVVSGKHLPRDSSKQTNAEKIESMFSQYEEKASMSGAVYWMRFSDFDALNPKYKEWVSNRLIRISQTNNKALKPHPFIQHVSANKQTWWFSGTSQKDVIKENLKKLGYKGAPPFVVEEESTSYIKDYRDFKKKKHTDYEKFLMDWVSKTRHFPEKSHGPSFFCVAQKALLKFQGEVDIDSYLGTLKPEKMSEIKTFLNPSAKKAQEEGS